MNQQVALTLTLFNPPQPSTTLHNHLQTSTLLHDCPQPSGSFSGWGQTTSASHGPICTLELLHATLFSAKGGGALYVARRAVP